MSGTEVADQSQPARLVLFGGPAGSGKSTLAKAWCATRERSAHIQLDEIRSLILAGYADPQVGFAYPDLYLYLAFRT